MISFSKGFSKVNAAVVPAASVEAVDVDEVVRMLRAAGVHPPLLLRFPDIVAHRFNKLQVHMITLRVARIDRRSLLRRFVLTYTATLSSLAGTILRSWVQVRGRWDLYHLVAIGASFRPKVACVSFIRCDSRI